MAPAHRVSDDDLEDVRIALVMNGGISLAVWIGGVTHEIHELTESTAGRESVYGDLLDVTRSSVQVDVIAGASAGGLNGAFLALATTYGTSLSSLADLWIDKGAVGRLLHSPATSAPASLLQGDGYFLPELRAAFAALWPDPEGPPRPPANHPIHLAMTATLFRGDVRRFTDDHGTAIIEVEHRGTFTFRRDHRTDPGASVGPRADPFADPAVIERLALAARSTASFPFLFEPSRVPVGADDGDLHPDMGGIVDLAASGWVLDGGVLVNRPVDLALRAVFERPASRQVRRHLLYVDPNPSRDEDAGDEDTGVEAVGEGDARATPGDATGPPPSLREVLVGSLVTLPRAQSLALTFEDLRRHNERVAHQRALRLDLVDLTEAEAGGLEHLSSTLWAAYRRERLRRTVASILEVVRGTAPTAPTTSTSPRPTPPTAPATSTSTTTTSMSGSSPAVWWTAEELRTAFEAIARQRSLPFLPDEDALDDPASEGWGIDHLERLAYLCLDVFQRAIRLAPLDAAGLRSAIRDLRGRLHDELFGLPALRADEQRFWEGAIAALPAPPDRADQRQRVVRRWLADQLDAWPLTPEERPEDPDHAAELRRQSRQAIEEATARVVALLTEALPTLREIDRAGDVRDSGSRRSEEGRADLRRLLDLVAPPELPTLSTTELTGRLHRVEVVHLLLAGEVILEQPVRVMQVDGGAPNSFDGPSAIGRKLTGSRLGHAAAFYKASWRANDWVWGRIDGSTRTAQLVLDPDRLEQLGYTTEEALVAIRRAALGRESVDDAADHPAASDRRELAARFDEVGCRDELRYLDDPALPTPQSLPTCAMQVARRRHLQILREDLGRIASGVDTDVGQGARRAGAGPTFRNAYGHLLDAADGRASDVPAAELFALMATSDIGAETIADDAGSGLFVGTASRTAAVGVAALDARSSGMGPVRILTRPLRLLLLVYASLVSGATRLGRVARVVVAVAVAGGAALVAVALLRDDVPLLIAGAGAALIVAGITATVLRARGWP